MTRFISRPLLRDLFLVFVLALFSLGVSKFFYTAKISKEKKLVAAESSRYLTEELGLDPLPASLMKSSTGRHLNHPPLSLTKFKKYHHWNKGMVIDVSSTSKYEKGHIPGSISLPASNFEELYPALAEDLEPYLDQLIVLYCSNKHCGSADLAQEHLMRHGYKFVGIFVGGMKEWKEAGEIIASGP